MAKETGSRYYGLILSPNMELTTEGYLICKNVPICRSGTQEYLGSELAILPGYQESWGLDSHKRYSVLRPKEEVLHSDTIASFEGKTVVDTHPTSEGNIVTVDNDEDVNCGHIQNVARGPDLGSEVTLQGDLIIKNPELIGKIRPENDPESGLRDVSCGYTLKLKRLADGTIAMFNIRGNHLAAGIEKGRAGSRIAIRDSAPPEIKPRKGLTMTEWRKKIFGRGLKETIAEASPEEIEQISAAIAIDAKPEEKKEEKKEEKPAADAHRMSAHSCLDRCMDAMSHKEGMGVDAFGKTATVDALKKELMSHLGKDEDMASDEKAEELKEPAKDEELKQDEKTAAEEKDETHAADSEHAEKTIDDPGKSVLGAANDSVRSFVKTVKPIVAAYLTVPRSRRTNDQQGLIDSYNSAVKTLNGLGANAYKAFTKVKVPEAIEQLATDSKSKPVVSCTCFDGVTYRKGLERHQQNCISKEGNK